MKFTAEQIATILQGNVEGNSKTSVRSIAKIEEAKEGDLCFLANPKYEDYIYETQASIVLVNDTFVPKKKLNITVIKVKDAYSSFAYLLKIYQEMISGKPKVGIEEQTQVATSAQLGKEVYVGSFAYISENVMVGDNTKIHPQVFIGERVKIGKNCILNSGVKIYHDCVIGDNVIIHAGTIIGADGFGFAFQNEQFHKIPQMGNVVIENDVEIGANCTIDRATMGSTIIRKGAKLDNLIQIAHNVEIGTNTVIAAQAGVSGSTKIGEYVMIGGQAGIVGHIQIANGTKINAQSGVSKSIKKPNKAVTSSPAFEYRDALKSQAIIRNLPSLQERINHLEEKIKSLLNKK